MDGTGFETTGENVVPAATGRNEGHLVVAHMRDGRVVKGVLLWHGEPGRATCPSHLPDLIHLQHEEGPNSTVRVEDTKAVFFVRTHQGDHRYEAVRFSSDEVTSDVWVQVRLVDGEVLEGSAVNNLDLIVGPGFWLWPSDKLCNNSSVYVPKGAVVEFHVLGVATPSLS